VREKWKCVPEIARYLLLTYLPQGDNSAGPIVGILMNFILAGPVHRSFCLFRTGSIDMHQKVSHCNVHPFTAACSASPFATSQLNPHLVGHGKKKRQPVAGLSPEILRGAWGWLSSLTSR